MDEVGLRAGEVQGEIVGIGHGDQHSPIAFGTVELASFKRSAGQFEKGGLAGPAVEHVREDAEQTGVAALGRCFGEAFGGLAVHPLAVQFDGLGGQPGKMAVDDPSGGHVLSAIHGDEFVAGCVEHALKLFDGVEPLLCGRFFSRVRDQGHRRVVGGAVFRLTEGWTRTSKEAQ